MKNLNQHVKSDKVKWIITGIALVLILAILGGVLAAVLTETNPKDWFEQPAGEETETSDEETSANTENGGAVIGAPVENGIKLMSAKIPVAEFAANGVSTQAETAYTLTATLDPADVIDKTVDWAVEFVNPSSSWATGKTVTDYVTVTPTSDGALTANVECLQAFGEQIKVVVTSRSNSEAKAECTVDYARRILDYALNIGVGKSDNGTEYDTFIDFGQNELLIDFAAVSYVDALQGSEYYDGSDVWGARIVSLVTSPDFQYEDDDLNDPMYVAADVSESLNALFSDYTIKDNMLFENNVNSELTANLQFVATLNSEVRSILSDYFTNCGKNSTTLDFAQVFPNVDECVCSNFLTAWKYECDILGSVDMAKLKSLYNDFFSELVTWLEENPDTPVWTFDVTLTGKYSTFTKTFTVRFDPETVALPVFNVSLDNGSIVF